MERKREEKYIYIEWGKKIFSITISIMRHHQPGIIISWTFISRQDNKCPVAQLFLTNLAIVFHPPSEHRVFPRFRDFFLFFFFFPSFSLSFDTFNKGKTLYQIPFHCDLFYLVHERVYTFYFSNRYNF